MLRFFPILLILTFYSTSILAATPEVIAMAKNCVKAPASEAKEKKERIARHKKEIQCLKKLYIYMTVSKEEKRVEKQLRKRLNSLQISYFASRDICRLNKKFTHNKKKTKKKSCGTMNLAPRELRNLFKTMIINEDAGWVAKDPKLVQALKM